LVKFAILKQNSNKGEIKINDQVITESNQPLPEKTADNTCSACSGTLYVECSCTEGYGTDHAYADCPYCSGTGTTLCPICNADQI